MAKVDWNQSEYSSEQRNFDPVPKGRYLCTVEEIEQKDTKEKTGSYLEVKFKCIAPKEHKGRMFWSRLNVNNKSEIAQRIGREQFNALCIAAVGALDVRNTDKLLAKRVVLHVSIERDQDQQPRNRVDGFEAPKDQVAGSAPSGAPAPSKIPEQPSSERSPDQPAPPPAGKFDDFEDDIPF